MYETAGKLKWIGETQSFPSGFSKREFVVTTAADKYPQDLKFEVVKDKCTILDSFELEQDVQGTPVHQESGVRMSGAPNHRPPNPDLRVPLSMSPSCPPSRW